jgi:hypothetical protein
MRLNGIRCDSDGCVNEHLFAEIFSDSFMRHIPDGWLSVFIGKTEEYKDIHPLQFCSKHCLLSWIKKTSHEAREG